MGRGPAAAGTARRVWEALQDGPELGAVAGWTGAGWRQESKLGQRLGSLAGAGVAGSRLEKDGGRGRCSRSQRWLWERRKGVPCQKALPGCRPGEVTR